MLSFLIPSSERIALATLNAGAFLTSTSTSPVILVLSLSSEDNTSDKVVSEKMGQTMLDNIYPYEYYEIIFDGRKH
jgi:hypothetical protein